MERGSDAHKGVVMVLLCVLGMMVMVLVGGAALAPAAESPCLKLPQGSLSRMECEGQEAARILQERQRKQDEGGRSLGTSPRGTTMHDFMCDLRGPSGVTFITGLPGDTVHGRVLNTLGKTAHGVGVTFEFLDQERKVVGQVIAAVFPGTLGPSGVGDFQVKVPHRAELSRPWDCVRVTVVERDPQQIQIR